MLVYFISITLILILTFYQPVIIIMSRKRHGIRLANRLSWASLASLISASTLSFNNIENSADDLHVWMLMLLMVLVVILISKRFGERTYTVPEVSGLDLGKVLKKAIESAEMKVSEIEVLEENRKNVFKIQNSKMKVVLELKDRVYVKESYYEIRFNHRTKRKDERVILDYISEEMTRFEIPKRKTLYTCLEAVVFLVILIVVVGVLNSKLLQETAVYGLDDMGIPASLQVERYYQNPFGPSEHNVSDVKDSGTINTFYNAFSMKKTYFIKYYDSPQSFDAVRYVITFGNPERALIVNGYGCYLYIPYETLAQTSPIRRLMVNFYKLYGSREGNVYRLIDDQEATATVMELFGIK